MTVFSLPVFCLDIVPIMSGVPIDVGMLIYTGMHGTSSHRSSGIWFHSLITCLCREASVVMENDKDYDARRLYCSYSLAVPTSCASWWSVFYWSSVGSIEIPP